MCDFIVGLILCFYEYSDCWPFPSIRRIRRRHRSRQLAEEKEGRWKDFAWQPYQPILPRPTRLSVASIFMTGIDSQPQSLLLSRVPAEVRVLIFSYAVGQHVLNITDGRSARYLPREPSPRVPLDPMRARHLFHNQSRRLAGPEHWYGLPRPPIGAPPVMGYRTHPTRLLALLLTCRTTWVYMRSLGCVARLIPFRYRETIDHLYPQTIFMIRHMHVLRSLPRFVLPQRLVQIRTLYLRIALDAVPSFRVEFQEAYQDTWASLQGLSGLEELRVSLQFTDLRYDDWGNSKKMIANSVRSMQQPSLVIFEVVVPHIYPLRDHQLDRLDWGRGCIHTSDSECVARGATIRCRWNETLSIP